MRSIANINIIYNKYIYKVNYDGTTYFKPNKHQLPNYVPYIPNMCSPLTNLHAISFQGQGSISSVILELDKLNMIQLVRKKAVRIKAYIVATFITSERHICSLSLSK